MILTGNFMTIGKKLAIGILCFWQATALAQNGPTAPSPLSLKDAYKAALTQSEALKLSATDIEAAQIRYRSALSSAFPQLNLDVSERVRNSESSSSTNDSNNSSGANGGFVSGSKDRFLSSLNVIAPLFSGFREFIVADAAEAQSRAAELTTARSRELMLKDVADLFYQIILYERDLAELAHTNDILKERVEELRKFRTLGKSEDSEVFAAEAEIGELLATVEQTRGLLAESKELLAFLTGLPASEISPQDNDHLGPPSTLEEYLARGEKRSDVQANSELEFSASQRAVAATRERWPTLSLEGNAYGYTHPETNQDWDATLSMKLPVFDGGRITAHIDEQQLEVRRARLRSQEAKRLAARDIRVAFSNLKAAERAVAKFGNFVNHSERSYQAQKKDYQFGIVNNVAVLDSIRQLEDARRQLLTAEISALRIRVALEVAAGGPTL